MTQKEYIYIHSEEIEKYKYPDDCPFKTFRAQQTKSILLSLGNYTSKNQMEVSPRFLTEDELLLFHTKEYINRLKKVSEGNLDSLDLFFGLGGSDTPIFRDLFLYSSLAAGGTVVGAEMILKDKKVKAAFNPSGGYHHAFSDKAGGFCYINDVVIACMILKRAGKRVFCLDLDVHHGNGTQAAFYSDPDVFTLSIHESGKTLYPWSGFEDEIGENAGLGYNVNIPLPAGTDDELYCNVFNQIVPPLLNAFKADVVVLEIGMDVLSTDPLAHFKMTNNAFADILPVIISQNVPLLVVGGGGYNPKDTARGWALLWSIICGLDIDNDMYLGLGGDFLGNSEWNAGLRDKRIYITGEDKINIKKEAQKVVEYIKSNVFKIWKI
jgi:acetoin utilization protein AcuC